jgi:hypothetical protein
MKVRMMFSIVPALVIAPLAAQAQGSSAQADAQAVAQAQARTPQARIDAAMQTAARAHIPAALLESKIEEGQAKRVPQERIAAAVETRLQALIHASETMQRADIDAASAGELAVAADALQAGVSETALIRVSRSAPDERRVVAVAVLADLVRLGQASENAFARVSGALGSSAALANLHAEVASQLRLGGLSSTLDAAGIARIR